MNACTDPQAGEKQNAFEVFSSCRAIISAVMVGRLFLWPALRYGTGYQTVWEIRPSAETPSSVHWRRYYFQLTHVHSVLKLFGQFWTMRSTIYLLTYLLWWLITSKGMKMVKPERHSTSLVKVNVDLYTPCHEYTSKALRYGMHSQGISQCLAFPTSNNKTILTCQVECGSSRRGHWATWMDCDAETGQVPAVDDLLPQQRQHQILDYKQLHGRWYSYSSSKNSKNRIQIHQ